MLLKGIWQASPPGKEQSHELHAEEVTVVGVADSEVSLHLISFHAVLRWSNDGTANVIREDIPDPEEVSDARVSPCSSTSQASSANPVPTHTPAIRVGLSPRSVLSRPELSSPAATNHHVV